jgi:Na+:H+ antiporter, NhaA family
MARPLLSPAPHWSETPIARILGPMQTFVHRSASSGVVLMIATLVALMLANSPLHERYDALLHTEIALTVGPFNLHESLAHWINDGLMAIFFFLVGLEIKRELRVGELSNLRAALLPIAAAVGGVVVPAVFYSIFNWGQPGAAGWAIPMATDIAFALGVLALLGRRIPFGLTIFLTAVAIVDDLIAVLVIALFYSGGIDFAALGAGFALLAVLLAANVLGIRSIRFYVVIGIGVWLAFLQSGVHATIAGVLVALTVPARNRIDPVQFLDRTRGLLARFENSRLDPTIMLTDEQQQSAVLELEEACEDVQAPLQKMEHRLHFWVQFMIMPIFALANAGVALSFGGGVAGGNLVTLGVMVGLVAGKPIGLLGASWLAIRSGIAALPEGVQWRHMLGASCLAGIGFTMSLFIGTLGFGESELLAAAKLGILAASLIAGTMGYILLRRAPAAG